MLSPPARADADVAADVTLTRALLGLPVRQREVVFLHYHLDLPVNQIAQDLRLPPSTVKARLAVGRRRLEQALSHHAEMETP
jgi:RNA polymerase sigma-70 factor (ECF subfamily)